MPELNMLEEFLGGGQVDAGVFALRPDYRVLLLAVDGLVPGPSDQASDALLQAAEAAAGEAIRSRPVEELSLGGEDLTRYSGPPRLLRATGEENFDTVADGDGVVEHPDPGEVVWCDDAGVTCRRWNWRQARRTQLGDDTATALFILDALDPVGDQALAAAADDLVRHLARLGPGVGVVHRLIAADAPPVEGD